MAKFNQHTLNQEIEVFIREKDLKKQSYSPSDIAFIKKYEGSGGQAKKGASGEGLLHEFYTPDYIVNLMWDLVRYHGYDDNGTILEPAMGTGRMLGPSLDYNKCTGFEINPISARIAEICYPGAKIYNDFFETAFLEPPRFTNRIKNKPTWLKGYPFSLVIGNPPYGIYQNQYSSYFPEAKKMKQIEIFFISQGLKMLKTGGLLIYLTGSNFLRNGDSYNLAKEEIGKMAKMIDAYHFPPVFKATDVSTDVIVFRKL